MVTPSFVLRDHSWQSLWTIGDAGDGTWMTFIQCKCPTFTAVPSFWPHQLSYRHHTKEELKAWRAWDLLLFPWLKPSIFFFFWLGFERWLLITDSMPEWDRWHDREAREVSGRPEWRQHSLASGQKKRKGWIQKADQRDIHWVSNSVLGNLMGDVFIHSHSALPGSYSGAGGREP